MDFVPVGTTLLHPYVLFQVSMPLEAHSQNTQLVRKCDVVGWNCGANKSHALIMIIYVVSKHAVSMCWLQEPHYVAFAWNEFPLNREWELSWGKKLHETDVIYQAIIISFQIGYTSDTLSAPMQRQSTFCSWDTILLPHIFLVALTILETRHYLSWSLCLTELNLANIKRQFSQIIWRRS